VLEASNNGNINTSFTFTQKLCTKNFPSLTSHRDIIEKRYRFYIFTKQPQRPGCREINIILYGFIFNEKSNTEGERRRKRKREGERERAVENKEKK
jgi:hypothetical protein